MSRKYEGIVRKVWGPALTDEWYQAMQGENGSQKPDVDFTGNSNGTTDRGLMQINSATFQDLQRRYPQQLAAAGISNFSDMKDPEKNIMAGKIVFDDREKAGKPGWSAWYGAPPSLRAQYHNGQPPVSQEQVLSANATMPAPVAPTPNSALPNNGAGTQGDWMHAPTLKKPKPTSEEQQSKSSNFFQKFLQKFIPPIYGTESTAMSRAVGSPRPPVDQRAFRLPPLPQNMPSGDSSPSRMQSGFLPPSPGTNLGANLNPSGGLPYNS